MVDVTNRPDVAVRLRPLKSRLRHDFVFLIRDRRTRPVRAPVSASRRHRARLERVMGIEPT
jgi:hypothetical protein